MSVCLWEYFGDDVFGGGHVISAGKWDGCSLSRISIPQVKACAVNLEPTRNAMGVDKASLLAAPATTVKGALSPGVRLPKPTVRTTPLSALV